MRLFGCLVVQNEGDIIAELLSHLRDMQVFHKLFFYDLGSEDDTFVQAIGFRDVLHSAEILHGPYTEALRQELLLSHSKLFALGDWLVFVDADEFYAEDPRRLLALAEAEGAESLTTYQMEYGFTDVDLEAFGDEDTSLPIRKRRRHYLIDWTEERFYRYLPGRESGALSSERPSSRRLLNRHYQFRTPAQMELRLRTRLDNRVASVGMPGHQPWKHVFSTRWQDFVRPHHLFHFDAGPPVFGLPPGMRVEDYRRPGDPFGEELARIAIAFKNEPPGGG